MRSLVSSHAADNGWDAGRDLRRRTFLKIADEWQLSESDRLRVLGSPSRSTFHGWVAKVRQGKDITLSFDELVRISAVLGIYKALGILFPRESDADRWLRSEHPADRPR